MIELHLDSVRRSTRGDYYAVVFEGDDNRYFLAVWVGPEEGRLLISELEKQPQEFTDNLLRSQSEKGKLTYILISDLQDDIYRARAVFDNNGQSDEAVVRPADGFMMAARLGVPIYVTEAVMQIASSKRPNLITRLRDYLKRKLSPPSLL